MVHGLYTIMLVIVSDNTVDQINGVATTYREMSKHATVPIKFIHSNDFYNVPAPGYKDIRLALPFNISKTLKCADKIHIATEGPVGLAAMLWCRKNKKSYTTAYHTKFPEALVKWKIPIWLSRVYLKKFHSHASATLVTSATMQNELQWLNANTVVWSRGVNTEIFNMNGESRVPSNAMLYVGRVSDEKNIESFLKLKGNKIVVGDGPARAKYEKMYSDVVWKGWLTGKELAREYRNADVLVFTSTWDTFGLVMLESIACGTPVAGYNVTGPKDIVVNGVTGVLTQDDLQDAVKSAKKLGRVFGNFDWKNCWEIFERTVYKL